MLGEWETLDAPPPKKTVPCSLTCREKSLGPQSRWPWDGYLSEAETSNLLA